MAYHPEVDEVVLIERPQDEDCFKARITAVSDDRKMIKFIRVDVVDAVEEICSAEWIEWSENSGKNSELQNELGKLMDNFDRPNPETLLED